MCTVPQLSLLANAEKMSEYGSTQHTTFHAYNLHRQAIPKGVAGWEERTLGLFVKSFLPAFREKQHRNIFSHHTGWLAKFGWILTYLKI